MQNAKNIDPQIYLLISISLFTGLAAEEILGLTWVDINFSKNKINITKKVVNNELVNSHYPRSAIFFRELKNILIDYEKSRPDAFNFILPNKKSEPQSLDNLLSQSKTSEIFKEITFVDLIDNYVNLALNKNIPLNFIQINLGFLSLNDFVDEYLELIKKPKISTCLI